MTPKSVKLTHRFWIIGACSFFLVALSFIPTLFEYSRCSSVPSHRTVLLEHNYLFDYNFYLSRIRQGIEGRWTVTEKYYNHPHQSSLLQVVYLWMGKIGSVFHLQAPAVYHLMRAVFGFLLLFLTGLLATFLVTGRWGYLAYFFAGTAGSWPVLVGNGWRFGTHMGWWSVIDSLQRITTLPHVLIGQIFLVLFVWRFSFFDSLSPTLSRSPRLLRMVIWGLLGLLAGIIFPPTLIIVYMIFAVVSVLELILTRAGKTTSSVKNWIRSMLLPRIVFFLLSAPSLVYLQLMMKITPWSALALFDIEHRIPLPYADYALALGPMLPLGMLGLIVALFRRERALLGLVAWIISVGLLCAIFEHVPTQSPLRFTEALIHVPLGILTAYLFFTMWQFSGTWKRVPQLVARGGILLAMTTIILLGASVMGSMVFWLTDEKTAKGMGTWKVPIANQLVYPLNDFMDGVYFLRDNAPREAVVLGYVTVGNYIPAYAGHYVYIGHANTPDEDEKEVIVREFFSGKMPSEDAQKFLQEERISYIFFGPQEKEVSGGFDVGKQYGFLHPVYTNAEVVIYRVNPPHSTTVNP